jgi:hypothetical protein
MSGKIITALAAAVLIGSTAIASAQTPAAPLPHYYWGNGYNDYYGGPSVTFGLGVGPGYYGPTPGYYGPAPGYYDYAPGYVPGYDCGVSGCNWNDRRN